MAVFAWLFIIGLLLEGGGLLLYGPKRILSYRDYDPPRPVEMNPKLTADDKIGIALMVVGGVLQMIAIFAFTS